MESTCLVFSALLVDPALFPFSRSLSTVLLSFVSLAQTACLSLARPHTNTASSSKSVKNHLQCYLIQCQGFSPNLKHRLDQASRENIELIFFASASCGGLALQLSCCGKFEALRLWREV
jgi:hypothetical protein